MLPNYNYLTPHTRCAPCLEYPGEWQVYVNREKMDVFRDEGEDRARGMAVLVGRNKKRSNPDAEVKVCWEASANDPRIGKMWFMSFYVGYIIR